MIREKLTDTIVCVIRNTQPIKTDQLSRVLRMISEAVRGGGVSTNYLLDSPKKKLNDFSCHKISFRKGKIQMFKHLNDFFVRCSFPVLFGYTTIEDV